MGNCLTSEKARALNQEQGVAEAEAREVEEMKSMRAFDDGKKKEKMMMKFRLAAGEGNDHGVEREKVGVVRIKVVVTREELEQILNCDECDLKQSSMEKLVTAMNLRGRRINEVRRNDNNRGNWRPALESIPEDH
ncbi:DUF4228 domain-containing protein [Melia azedarach]|uniref:DUF4228 domain-containing protein n=1 Tax=Melia azedarach TaxID=155640 RepID=A0ACC1Z2Q4_MELAZ|nr:DUF4228 domain-containing protein [Melia azedarach]